MSDIVGMVEIFKSIVSSVGEKYGYTINDSFGNNITLHSMICNDHLKHDDRIDGPCLNYANIHVCVYECLIILCCYDISVDVDLRDPDCLDTIDLLFVDCLFALLCGMANERDVR